MINMKKMMPIGYEDIKEIVDKNLYYVDKTLLIKDLLDSGSKVNLFTRPRRFGKTLNLSILRRFFESEKDPNGRPVDNRYIFKDLKIYSQGERYLTHQGQYSVINLSLKSAKQPTYKLAYTMLKRQIGEEYSRHQYLLQQDGLTDIEKARFEAIIACSDDESLYLDALKFLSYCLSKCSKKNVIILIDEYDVPLENAYFEGFYNEMIVFIRSLFESALKTNPCLEFAVITGCLRISRESIFTGLNNLKIHSILSPGFADCFGFTVAEVKDICSYYSLDDKYLEVREWYDGYYFGRYEIYNPWSIINYIDTAYLERGAFPRPYWSNTSSNSIIRELVEESDIETRPELERLIAGESIEKPVHEDITYGDILESRDNLWNFLFFTGYLKQSGERQEEGTIYMQLSIPNTEIRLIYRDTILSWFDRKLKGMDMSPLFNAIDAGDCEAFGSFVSDQLLETISFYDYAENYYHGFLTGLLKTSKKYGVYSNRESGTGRSDIILKTPSVRGGAVILELKVTDRFDQMEEYCRKALSQIEDRDYEAGLRMEGYRNVMKYGICFYRKECLVMKADKE